jgi:DNA polymerase-3 subunit alpha
MTTQDGDLKVKKFNESGEELAIRFGLGAIKAVGVGAMSALADVRRDGGDFTDIYNFASRSGAKILNKKSVEALSKAGAFYRVHKNRNQLFESCETICKYGVLKEEENNSDQMSLFGSQSQVKIEDPALKDVEDWDK